MRFIGLTVISLKDNSIKRNYIFNPIGLNIVLGEKNLENEETNGVGKTALLECIRYCLGSKLPKGLKGKDKLEKEEIYVVLQIEDSLKKQFIGRSLSDENYVYVTDNFEDLLYNLSNSEFYTQEDFNKYIQNLLYSEFKSIELSKAPSLASVREYLMRDEKSGFASLELKERKAITVYQNLAFLSLLPSYYEKNLAEPKNVIKEINKKLSEIEEIGKDIKKLNKEYSDTLDEIDRLKQIIETVNISEKLEYNEEQYFQLKENLNKINLRIRKLEFARKQLYVNIKDLENNLTKIKEFINLQEFYKQTIGYFSEALIKNYEDMHIFYEFMLGNRGKYIHKQIDAINCELNPLYEERNAILIRLSKNTEVAKGSDLVSDLQSISNELSEKYKDVAEYNYKLEKYSEKVELENNRNKQKELLKLLTEKYKNDFMEYDDKVNNIVNHFHSLGKIIYKESCNLNYVFEGNTNLNSPTGRIKIECSIEEESSHGRFFMKIHMFDLSLLFNRIDNNQGLQFLFHDGSYAKIHSIPNKVNFFNYIDDYLKKVGNGQYFISLNIEELSEEAVQEYDKRGCVIARLRRTDDDSERFMGMRY